MALGDKSSDKIWRVVGMVIHAHGMARGGTKSLRDEHEVVNVQHFSGPKAHCPLLHILAIFMVELHRYEHDRRGDSSLFRIPWPASAPDYIDSIVPPR